MGDVEVKDLQGVGVGRAFAEMPWGTILHGDSLGIGGGLPGGLVDLVYMDPPFFTKRDQVGGVPKHRKGDGNGALAFTDSWADMAAYLQWLRPRVEAMRRLLKPSGVFLLHLDWHAVHYAKVLCDELFENESGGGFQNELIWYYQTGGASKGRFSRKHDTILFYSMSDAFYFDGKAIAIPRGAGAMKRAKCPTGARIKVTDTHKNPDDVLLVPALNPMARERNGYPTQKPVALLEILIKALCPAGGAVADLFCGSGTTLEAAERLQRKWIGADVNLRAVALARKRLGS